MKTKIFIPYIFILLFSYSALAQKSDWRNAKNGSPIFTNGYCDQPYVVVLENGNWFCVFTTNEGHEGTDRQHIVSSISKNQGKTWSDTVRIENPGPESASWAMPYLTNYGRIYVFYDYNGDKIHELNAKINIREDMLGWYRFRYSDDEGKTWSERFRLDIRKTPVDFNNDWNGEVQIMWGIGKPVNVDDGMMFAFTKIGKYVTDNSEGWFFKCTNIHSEKDPDKLHWQLLPDGETGLKNPLLGPINAEQNIFQLKEGSIYCMYRTISGNPAESYSADGGKTWTLPEPPVYENNITLKTPRACPRIWKCQNGKYLFWYHHHGGWNFNSRNPAWISGGVEKDGKIYWSQPEILLYEEHMETRMSYPDLIEQDGKYWITETNKANARSHPVPEYFFNTLWSQFDIDTVCRENLSAEWTEEELKPGKNLRIAPDRLGTFERGFTIDFGIELHDIAPGQQILQTKSENGKTITLRTGEYGAIDNALNEGKTINTWNSDPGLIKAYGQNSISVTVDNGPGIIQFVVNGVVCNGRDFRQYGWTHFEADMQDMDFSHIVTGNLSKGQGVRLPAKLIHLRIYNSALMNTLLIGNHRNFQAKKKNTY